MREYLDLVSRVLTHGRRKTNRTGVDTISCFAEHYRVDLAQGYPLLTTKRVNFKSMLHEVLWYLSGEDHIRNLRQHTKIWDAWADGEGNLDTAYARYWRRFPSAQLDPETGKYGVVEVDQIGRIGAFAGFSLWPLAFSLVLIIRAHPRNPRFTPDCAIADRNVRAPRNSCAFVFIRGSFCVP